MHKPTLLKVLRILKDLPAESLQRSAVIEHIIARAAQQDSSLDPQKLLAGAGLTG